MTRSKQTVLAASASVLLTAALARASGVWPTTTDISGASYIETQVKTGLSLLEDAGLALTSPIFGDNELTDGLMLWTLAGSTGGVPNTSNGAGDPGANPNNNGGTSTGGGGSPGGVAPEPSTLILTGVGIGAALLLSRRKRRTIS